MNFIDDDIHIPEQDLYEIQTYWTEGSLTIYDHPGPALTPDLLSILLVVATQPKVLYSFIKKCLKAACSL
jgi:UDP-N-acetylglucosamine 1-carboxyvinyltransferase